MKISTKMSKIAMNLLFVVFFSLAIIAQYFIPNNIVLDYWFLIFGILFFIAAFPYLNSFKIFITLVTISWIASLILAKLIFEQFHGYYFVLVLLYFKVLFVSSVTGFIAAKVCVYYVSKYLFNNNRLIIYGGGSALLLAFTTTFIFVNFSSGRTIQQEVINRLQLAKKISLYYNQSNNKHIDNQVVIEQKLIEGIYLAKGGIISHGYGGDITISSDDLGISLVYKDIPKGEACYMFYFSDSPRVYGFYDIFVNDELVRSHINYKSIKNGKEICYASDEKVTIRYTGSYADFEQASKYL